MEGVLRTPDECFEGLDDFPYEPDYVEVGGLRMAWVEDGPKDGKVVLCLHGEPTWSYLYRSMLPILGEAGFRAIAPDLIGFGRSDKPTDRSAYTYAGHVGWLSGFVDALGLQDYSLFLQDWGGLLGLRLATDRPTDVANLILANTTLPVGESPSEGFDFWRKFSQEVDPFDAGALVQGATHRTLTDAEVAAYNAPFPDASYQAGARQFPLLVPVTPDDPAVRANKVAWEELRQWFKPALTLWAPNDPVLGNQQEVFLKGIPGSAGLPHQTFDEASHFVQEDVGPELAKATIGLVGRD